MELNLREPLHSEAELTPIIHEFCQLSLKLLAHALAMDGACRGAATM